MPSVFDQFTTLSSASSALEESLKNKTSDFFNQAYDDGNKINEGYEKLLIIDLAVNGNPKRSIESEVLWNYAIHLETLRNFYYRCYSETKNNAFQNSRKYLEEAIKQNNIALEKLESGMKKLQNTAEGTFFRDFYTSFVEQAAVLTAEQNRGCSFSYMIRTLSSAAPAPLVESESSTCVQDSVEDIPEDLIVKPIDKEIRYNILSSIGVYFKPKSEFKPQDIRQTNEILLRASPQLPSLQQHQSKL